mmetsp:Transcript_29059/g.57993  ORF Transcript_29059/g.57993 Transcript_29059/m.57993 type:complete len:436 (+) Transcript_29059:79-1386(+)
MMHYTPQAKTLALLPKFTATLSFMGSTFIFQDVALHKRSSHRVYDRLVFGLSCSDMVASIVNILSTWPMPEGTPGVFLASGTTQTCTTQGFFAELGNMATPLYNASLCLYYLLLFRQGWTEDMIRTRAEPIMHIMPTTLAFTISILGIPFKLYNNSGWLCWIAAYPGGCQQTGTCTRGEYADMFRWIHYAIIWSAISFVTAGMYAIYRKVKTEEANINSRRLPYDQDADDIVRRNKKARKVAIQAALFIGALYLTWVFTTITRIYQIATGRNEFALLVLMAIFFPLQGFFNALIYIRPRYLRCRSRHPERGVLKVFVMALYPEKRPIHGGQNVSPGRNMHPEVLAQNYSMEANLKKDTRAGRSSAEESVEDAGRSIDTAMAKAESICQSDDSGLALSSRREEKIFLDAVEESDGVEDEFEDEETLAVNNTESARR